MMNFNDNFLGSNSTKVGLTKHIGSTLQAHCKHIVWILLILFVGVGQMWADNAGFWSDGAAQVTFTVNGRTVSVGMNSSSFSDYDLGTVESLTLSSAWAKTWKNSSGNVCGVDMYYKVATTKPNTSSMTKVELRTFSDLGSGDQQISKSGINANLASGLTAGTTYYVTINFDLYGNKGGSSGCYTGNGTLNNGGSHYIFKFKMADSNTKFTKDKYIYLDARNQTNWKSADFTARFYFKRYDTSADIANVTCANTNKLDSWVYYAVVPNGNYNGKLQVDRVNPNNISEQWCTTSVVAASDRSSGNNCLGGSSSSCSWSSPSWTTYAPPLSSVSLSDNGTVTYGGDGGSSTPYLVEKSGSIKVSASGTKAVADPDATIWYDIKDNTTSKQNSTTATYTYTASSTAGTTHQMKVDGYTKVSSTSSTKLTSSIVYYQTVNCYTVTYNANGATDGSIPTVSGTKYLGGTDVTLATNTGSLEKEGYSFNGWNDDPDGEGTHYDAGGTLSDIGANATLYAEWSETPSLTVNAGTHVGTVTGSNAAVTLGNSYAISASNFDAGYEFNNWTASPAGNASFASSTSASTNVTVNNGSVTVTANAREKMTTVTINANPAGAGTFTVDASAFTEGNTTTAGVTTSRTVVATANSGKVFHNWTVTGNATGSASTNTYTLEGNGSAGTGTLTANFGILSGWNMEGEDFGGWDRPSTYKFSYPYRGMSGVYYIPTTLTGNRWWKVNNSTTPFSAGNASTTVSKGTIYNLVEEWSNSCKVTSTMSDVWVVINTNDTKKIWVQDPQTYYNVNVTNEGSGTKGTYKVTLNSTSAFTKGANEFETTQFANGEDVKITVTGVDGYIPTITIGANVFTFWKQATSYETTFTMGSADVNVNITYTAAYAVTFAKTAGCATLSVLGPESATITTGTKVKSGTTINFSQEASSGYEFTKWYSTSTGTGGTEHGTDASLAKSITAATSIYPIYRALTFTVTLDKQTSATGYGGSPGTIGNQTVTYNSTPSKPSGTLPTAANGYAFMGFYTETGGGGLQIIDGDGNWVASVSGYTDGSKCWLYKNDVTLYAYYKQAELTAITLNGSAFEPKKADDPATYVTANPTIAPNPAGTVVVCWELLYDNDNPVVEHDALDDSDGSHPNRVKFSINGLAAGGYKIRAKLYLNNCNGTLLDTRVQSFIIASDFSITVQYKCGDVTIKSSTPAPAKALEWTSITAPDIVGYAFSKWKAGDGVTIQGADGNGEKTGVTINYKANYDGTLTAIYTRKRMIYFYNSLGWSDVYVYFYNSDKYWSDTYGTGAKKGQGFGDGESEHPYWEEEHGHMTQIAGTNVWYFDCNNMTERANVAFTEANKHDNNWFWQTKAVRRGDYNRNMPMFVPLTTRSDRKNETDYYNNGYWMNYPENTGYTLRLYDTWNANNSTGASREYLFPYSEDLKMPLKLDVELNFTGQKWFMIYRNDNVLMGVNATMTQESHEAYRIQESIDKIEIKTSAPGTYTFTLTYYDDGKNECGDGDDPCGCMYHISVDYPVAVGDYRIKYNDRASWSGSAHSASWWHASDIIRKNTGSEAKSDTVSLYVAYGSASPGPSAKFQKVTEIDPGSGIVTWSDVASGTVSLSGISKKGVYNFIVSQPADGESISLTKTEPYDGNYYIRTDNAGSTKWDNFRTRDHQMTYTEFSMSDANSFGDKYSHYFASWCERGTNIKFCIANDYSSCISDTLAQDVGDPYKNTDSGGTLKSDGAGLPINDKYSANVRFMYNEETNKISRAYVGSSTNPERKFLILEGNQVLKGDDDEDITDWSPKKALILQDDQNWIYERVLKILPGTRFKLYSCYAQKSVESDSAQYFRGAYESGAWAVDNTKSVILIDGSGGYQMARIIYDFKTNRLIAAWIPSGSDVSGDMAINADVLVEREHQEAAQYITFANETSKLSKVKTVYGAMKFNRWILNNRGGSADHDPDHGKTADQLSAHHPPLEVGDQKSIYERSLYFISFPFDVKVSEIFGFGHYWDEWYLEYYDGLNRAKNGYWMDSEPNWKFVTPAMADTMVLRAYQGYILGLDLDFMQADNFSFWSNGITTIELFFPSTVEQDVLEAKNVTLPALPSTYECTINRGTAEGDRRVKDSYWRCIGVPSFNIYNSALTDASGEITWKTSYDWKADNAAFPFIYMWNRADNTLTPQSTNRFTFLPMHAYLVQNGKQINWTNVSAATPSIVARRENAMPVTEYEWRLELAKDSQIVDQAYIRMSNLEQVTDTFDFGQDLIKELNNPRSNIYSYIGYERVAANSMTLHTDSMTVIPVGVNIVTAGDYTFAMPDGTDGVGVTLVDSETGTRTNLGAGMTYTLSLAKGDYNNRLFLEISPVKETPTGIEDSGFRIQDSGVRKVLIDGILYIVRDGKIFDARGVMVK